MIETLQAIRSIGSLLLNVIMGLHACFRRVPDRTGALRQAV